MIFVSLTRDAAGKSESHRTLAAVLQIGSFGAIGTADVALECCRSILLRLRCATLRTNGRFFGAELEGQVYLCTIRKSSIGRNCAANNCSKGLSLAFGERVTFSCVAKRK